MDASNLASRGTLDVELGSTCLAYSADGSRIPYFAKLTQDCMRERLKNSVDTNATLSPKTKKIEGIARAFPPPFVWLDTGYYECIWISCFKAYHPIRRATFQVTYVQTILRLTSALVHYPLVLVL
jgi:hypothetical protein